MRSPLVCTCLLLLVATGLAGPVAAARPDDKGLLERLAAERQRRMELADWAARVKPTQEQYFFKVYEPVIEGNKQDYGRNLELAEKFRSRAQKAADQRMQETADKYKVVAKLFFDCAQVNREILLSISEREGERLTAAFQQILELESKIFRLTSKRPEREWFTPAELAVGAGGNMAEQDPGTTPPAESPPRRRSRE